MPRPPKPAAPPPVATLITDRALYKENDTVRVKAYLRAPTPRGEMGVPSAAALAEQGIAV